MKAINHKIYYFTLFILLFAFAQESMAQNATTRTRQRPSETTESPSVVNLTERARIKNEVESSKPSHIVWERMLYRIVDLTKETNNAALYYPVQPQGGRQNLFTLIFKLLADNKVAAYRYMDNGEVFEDNYKLNFEETLKSLQLYYTKQGERFIVDERDIPGMEVTQYMIKEGYYFDQATGMFQTRVLALCPILVREDYYSGGKDKQTLFWLNYDDIRPYLSREMIMTSDYNNALTNTIDDYFRKNMYTGEIIKTVNMMGKTLMEQVKDKMGEQKEDESDPEVLMQAQMKLAQDSIEAQLKAFNENLWVYNDSVRVANGKAQNKKVEKSPRATSGRAPASQGSSANTKEKTQKVQKEPKSQSAPRSETTATRSVRRTR